jgi:hypothetical protein
VSSSERFTKYRMFLSTGAFISQANNPTPAASRDVLQLPPPDWQTAVCALLLLCPADSSLGCSSCNHCTFMGILIEADRTPKEGAYGHHGVTLARGSYNLVTDFVVAAPQVRGGRCTRQSAAGRLAAPAPTCCHCCCVSPAHS